MTTTVPTRTVKLPPGPKTPALVQGTVAVTAQRRGIPRLREHYGDAFTVKVPGFGQIVVISDPGQVRQLFLAGPDVAENLDQNLGRVLGPGSMFALTGERHRKERKLLVPPFHGRRLAAYERITEEETERELASWPEGRPFAVMPSTMRITVNVILRAVFGATGQDLDLLRVQLPKAVKLGSILAAVPLPKTKGKWTPWGRAMALRQGYDAIIERMIAAAEADPELDQRDDVLALMVQARYEDGSRMTNSDIADELLTLLAAGHETTATSLAWAVERLRRNPQVLARVQAEARDGESALRTATIYEVQRTRPVITGTGRIVAAAEFELGKWRIPKGYRIFAATNLIHSDERFFERARQFDPDRFLERKPDTYTWIPFGGGTRRCIGAAFAHMEMDIVLRTLLREFDPQPTTESGERWHNRGVAFAPARGGRAVLRRVGSLRPSLAGDEATTLAAA